MSPRGSEGSDWSLEAELLGLTGASTLREVFLALGLAESEADVGSLNPESEWRRGGEETYLHQFKVEPFNAQYVIKACVAYAPDSSVGALADQWFDRRAKLAPYVSTPKVYGRSGATWVEEFIPLKLAEAFAPSQSGELDWAMLTQLATFAGAASGLGFAGINPFHDVRSRGRDVVAVDFGQDLGPPHFAGPHAEFLEQALASLRSANIPTTAEQRRHMYSVFASVESAAAASWR